MSRAGSGTADDGFRPLAGLDALIHRGVQLVWLNLWWMLLTLLGGIVLGIGPATVAAHSVASAWACGEKDVDVPRTMWAQWRRHWRPAATAGLLAIALVLSLAATWWLSRSRPPIPAAVTQGLVLLVGLLLVSTLPYLASIIERTDVAARPRLSFLFAAALALGTSRPVLTLALVLIWTGWPALLIVSGWPGLLPVVGVSVPLAASTWCIHRALPRPSDPLPAHHAVSHLPHDPERTS